MQDTTPLEGRRRRLLFRANHRGTRENDILIGNFVATRLAAFSAEEIGVLEIIMELPDTWLADWLTGRTPISGGYCACSWWAAQLCKAHALGC